MVLIKKMSIFLLILLFLNSTHFCLFAYGRPEPNSLESTKVKQFLKQDQEQGQDQEQDQEQGQGQEQEEKMMMRGLIGSRPPRCERVRCLRSCGHCEAIQVPTNPQTKKLHHSHSTEVIDLDYVRGEDNSNYKPMSWKCKCGNSIYNP